MFSKSLHFKDQISDFKFYFRCKNVNSKQIPNSNFKIKDLKFKKSLHFQRSNKILLVLNVQISSKLHIQILTEPFQFWTDQFL